jgi:hypothetical protein
LSHLNQPRIGALLILMQASVCVLGTAVMLLAPPASGEVLLVPLTATGAARMPALATTDGTRMIARGPVAGSIVVRGDGYRIARRMIASGILAISASTAGCEQAA